MFYRYTCPRMEPYKFIEMRLLLLLCCLPALVWAQESRLIKGKITDGNNSLADVAITLEGKQGGTYSNSEGRYEIEAAVGDYLHYSYAGMKTVRVLVEDVTYYVNVALVPDYTELEEVTVGNRLKSQVEMSREYATNKNIIRSAFGFLDADKTHGRVMIVDGSTIDGIYLCISDYLRNRFAGVYVTGACPNGTVYLRNIGSLGGPNPVIFDVDGQVFTETPNWLDPNQINRLAIMSSYSMATRYGAQGAGGVIVINTVNSQFVAEGMMADAANWSAPRAMSEAELLANAPTYWQRLVGSTSEQEAKSLYSEYAARYAASPYFFLDAYQYFYERRSDRAFADAIIDEHRDKLAGNPVLLKALAYLYQGQGRAERARELYKDIFILRPQYGQSYLDMAMAYWDVGEFTKAASMFGRYQYLLKEGYLVGSDDFWLMQQHDSDNLFQVYGERMGTDVRLVTTDPYVEGSTRLVFEWNDSGAEFELQFVNPGNRAYTWEHTQAANARRIEDEQMAGYTMEEYIIDPSTPGQWTVNISYLGNKSLTPTYLKMTVYYNFGRKNQTKEVHTYKLFLQGSNQRLFALTSPGTGRIQG